MLTVTGRRKNKKGMWQGERKKGTGNLVTSWRTSPDGRKSRRILLASQHDWCTPYVYVIIHTCTCRCHGCMLLKARAMHARTHTAVHKCLIVRAFNSMLKAGTRMHTHTHTHTHRHTGTQLCTSASPSTGNTHLHAHECPLTGTGILTDMHKYTCDPASATRVTNPSSRSLSHADTEQTDR